MKDLPSTEETMKVIKEEIEKDGVEIKSSSKSGESMMIYNYLEKNPKTMDRVSERLQAEKLADTYFETFKDLKKWRDNK